MSANIFFIIKEDMVDIIQDIVKKNDTQGTRYVFCSQNKVLDKIKKRVSNDSLIEYHVIDFKVLDTKEEYLKTWPSLFNNISTYIESSTYNLGVFEKVYIDEIGNIKNNIHDDYTITSVFDIKICDLEKIVKNSILYKEKSNIQIENVLVCRDCEFRRMCVDITSIKKSKIKNTYIKEKECTYNPYISKWENSLGYMKLEESGVKVNEEVFNINHEKVQEINNNLWDD